MAMLSAAASPFCRPEEDPFLLLESSLKAIERILQLRRGLPLRRAWIDQPYGEEEITLMEEEVIHAIQHAWRGWMSSMSGCWPTRSCCSAAGWRLIVKRSWERLLRLSAHDLHGSFCMILIKGSIPINALRIWASPLP